MLRQVVATLSVALGATLLLILGFVVGRLDAGDEFRGLIAKSVTAAQVGNFVSANVLADMGDAYFPEQRSKETLKSFTWSVANVPTPFLGGTPQPGEYSSSVVNVMQFRNADLPTMPKPISEYRIFLTGGATAFGSGASSNQRTIGANLERMLRALTDVPEFKEARVFIAANPGWTTTHERILIENTLSELAPDLVISLSGFNDVYWGKRGENIYAVRTHYDQHFWQLLQSSYRLAGHTPLVDPVHPAKTPVDCHTIAARLEKNVKLSTYALSLTQTRYMFVLQPIDLAQAERRAMLNNEPAPDNSMLIACFDVITKRLSQIRAPNFQFLDFKRKLEEHPGRWTIDLVHFGDRGNELIASELKRELTRELQER